MVTTDYILTAFKNGCTLYDTVRVNVSDIALTAGPDVTLCASDAIELVATGATFYQWSPPDGLSDPSIPNPIATPDVTTTYRIIGTDAIGCVDTAFITVRVLDTIGVQLEVGVSTAEAGSDTARVPIFIIVEEDDLPLEITRLARRHCT